MTTRGIVREWREDGGWGVIDAKAAKGGIWTHCSSVLVAGHRSLTPGEEVHVTWEPADQDGFSFRAVEAWPVGELPVRLPPSEDPSPAYGSELVIDLEPSRTQPQR